MKIPTLSVYEEIIEQGAGNILAARIENGYALAQIKDKELWREGDYGTFEDYLERRWNYKKAYGYHLVDTGRMNLALSNGESGTPDFPNEYQLRELKKVKIWDATEDTEWQKRATAWEQACSEIGPDASTDELHNYLLDRQFITPRAKKNYLNEGDRQDKREAAEFKRINKALEILAEASFDRAYAVKRWGRAQMPHMNKAAKWFDL